MAGDFESGTNEENNGDMREEGRKTAGGFIWTVSNLGGEESSSVHRSTRNLLSVSITDDAQVEGKSGFSCRSRYKLTMWGSQTRNALRANSFIRPSTEVEEWHRVVGKKRSEEALVRLLRMVPEWDLNCHASRTIMQEGGRERRKTEKGTAAMFTCGKAMKVSIIY